MWWKITTVVFGFSLKSVFPSAYNCNNFHYLWCLFWSRVLSSQRSRGIVIFIRLKYLCLIVSEEEGCCCVWFMCFEHIVLIIHFTLQVNVWCSANSSFIWYVAANGCTCYQVTFDPVFTSHVFAFFALLCCHFSPVL